MIPRAELVERAHSWGLSEDVVEKDYVLGWLLWGMGSDPLLSRYWAFKGGTCLKKCFFETYRFSEDLDFSVLPGYPHQDAARVFTSDAVAAQLVTMLKRVEGASGINLSVRELYLKERNEGRALEGRVYYLGPSGSTQVAKVKLDVSGTERVVRPTVLMPIQHNFTDRLPPPATVRTYAFEEVFAEKIRAMGERGRPRDLYDIVNLYRHRGLGRAPELVRTVLVEKCASKGVALPTVESVLDGEARLELEAEWTNMLAHQLPALPPIEVYLDELVHLFTWLDGELELEELTVARVAGDEGISFSPPPLAARWGGAQVEALRFAGANLLLVELGYKGGRRVIEPYSFRRSRAGDLLLYAQRPEESGIKAYRVDRMEGVRVLTRAFEPRYRVELFPGGAISARPTRAARAAGVGTRGVRAASWSGMSYRYACAACGREFEHKVVSNTLREHKAPDGLPCPGRVGYRI